MLCIYFKQLTFKINLQNLPIFSSLSIISHLLNLNGLSSSPSSSSSSWSCWSKLLRMTVSKYPGNICFLFFVFVGFILKQIFFSQVEMLCKNEGTPLLMQAEKEGKIKGKRSNLDCFK